MLNSAKYFFVSYIIYVILNHNLVISLRVMKLLKILAKGFLLVILSLTVIFVTMIYSANPIFNKEVTIAGLILLTTILILMSLFFGSKTKKRRSLSEVTEVTGDSVIVIGISILAPAFIFFGAFFVGLIEEIGVAGFLLAALALIGIGIFIFGIILSTVGKLTKEKKDK